MALNNSSDAFPLLTPKNEAAFASFTRLCAESDNLIWLEGLEDRDIRDGLSDPPTLLYVTRYTASIWSFLILIPTDDF